MSDKPIVIEQFTRKFGDFTAVEGVSFSVDKGEIFGLLGPNGAGKSTLIRMLCTLLRPTQGSARIAGFDVLSQPHEVRENIGLVAERMILYERLTARENLLLFGRLNHLPRKQIDSRVDYLLNLLQMDEWRNGLIGTFSTGMKQRLNLARALLHSPSILFLDEPTLALDPQTTSIIHDLIRKLAADGITIILTTHIMTEAESLSDRVAIIDHGKICALDTPENLKQLISASFETNIQVTVPNPDANLISELNKIRCVDTQIGENVCHIKLTSGGDGALYRVIDTIRRNNKDIASINTSRPTLEDVFLHLTGRQMRDDATGKVASGRVDHRVRHAPNRTR